MTEMNRKDPHYTSFPPFPQEIVMFFSSDREAPEVQAAHALMHESPSALMDRRGDVLARPCAVLKKINVETYS